MGRLEKIVVLTVLFLVAVILGVSLNQGDELPQGAADPASAGELAGLPGESPAGMPDPRPAGTDPRPAKTGGPAGAFNASLGASTGSDGALEQGASTLASGSAQPEEDGVDVGAGEPSETPPPEPTTGDPAAGDPAAGHRAGPQEVAAEPVATTPPAPAGPVSWLMTEEGLRTSQDPGAKLYTWAAGDTYAALAERYYGSRQQVTRLHKANEGRGEATLEAGDVVFVPTRAAAPDEVIDTTPAGAGQWFGGTYIVESGDMLGKIAQTVYGSASKWRLIYEANRDVLANPDALQVGMKLRIPAVE